MKSILEWASIKTIFDSKCFKTNFNNNETHCKSRTNPLFSILPLPYFATLSTPSPPFFNHPHHVTGLWYLLQSVCSCMQVWMELLSQAPQQYVVAASCPWMGAWLCLMMQASHIPIDLNMLLEIKARSKV